MVTEFQSILIREHSTIKDALKQLDSNAEKILFVVDNQFRLIGSLTDGDIRRWLLNDGKISGLVEEACFKDAYFVQTNYDILKVKKEIFKRRIDYVPVLDKNRVIIEFLIWDKLFDATIKRKIRKTIDNPVVIMAGGKGTRLDPFTKILPKPLIPIGEKTILEIIIDKFIDHGINQFYISVNHKAQIIKSYFEELQTDYKLEYIYENKPLGTIGALKFLETIIKKDIILTNCDNIIDVDLSDLVSHHLIANNDITVVTSLKNYNIPYGICEVDNKGRLTSIVEKPEYNFFVNTGMYIIKPKILNLIPENTIFHATQLIESVKQNNGTVGVFPISENSWTDTGEWSEYKKAVAKLNL